MTDRNIKKSSGRKPHRSTNEAEKLYDNLMALGYSSREAMDVINEIYERHNKPKGAKKC